MHPIKISVIIPCYNAEKFIERCLYSLNEQYYKDFEVIIIDDASQDKTLDKIGEISLENFSSNPDIDAIFISPNHKAITGNKLITISKAVLLLDNISLLTISILPVNNENKRPVTIKNDHNLVII